MPTQRRALNTEAVRLPLLHHRDPLQRHTKKLRQKDELRLYQDDHSLFRKRCDLTQEGLGSGRNAPHNFRCPAYRTE